jgi:hypothetical protein
MKKSLSEFLTNFSLVSGEFHSPPTVFQKIIGSCFEKT